MIKISKSIIAALTAGTLIVGISGCKEQGTPVEDAGKKIDQSLDKTGQNINTALDKAGQKIEKAGKKIEDKVKDSRK